jgi:hypothetical protein
MSHTTVEDILLRLSEVSVKVGTLTGEISGWEVTKKFDELFTRLNAVEQSIAKLNGERIRGIEEDVESLKLSRSEGWGAWKLLGIACAVAGAVAAIVALIIGEAK